MARATSEKVKAKPLPNDTVAIVWRLRRTDKALKRDVKVLSDGRRVERVAHQAGQQAVAAHGERQH